MNGNPGNPNRRGFIKNSAKTGAGLLLWPTTSWSVSSAPADPLEQKIGRLFCLNMYWRTPPSFLLRSIERYHVGGIYLDKNPLINSKTAMAASKKIREVSPVPIFIITDCEGGVVNKLRKVEAFPSARSLGDAFRDGTLTEDGLYAKFRKKLDVMKGLGFNFNFDPVLDLSGSYIRTRSLGADPEMVAKAARICLRAYRDTGIHATAKHFPGMSSVSQDPHQKVLPSIKRPVKELMDRDLVPFIAAIEEDISSIMVGHCKFSALDDNLPASLSPVVLQDFVRKELGFKGAIWPDSFTMGAISKFYAGKGVRGDRMIYRCCVDAIKAGVDMIFNFRFDSSKFPVMVEAVKDAVKDGTLSESRIDESLERIAKLHGRYGG